MDKNVKQSIEANLHSVYPLHVILDDKTVRILRSAETQERHVLMVAISALQGACWNTIRRTYNGQESLICNGCIEAFDVIKSRI